MLRTADCFNLHMIGGPRIPSIYASAAAVRLRTAVLTCPSWQTVLADLEDTLITPGFAAWWNLPQKAPILAGPTVWHFWRMRVVASLEIRIFKMVDD
eukprot:8200616-Pyramimonas_sp.AAC.1